MLAERLTQGGNQRRKSRFGQCAATAAQGEGMPPNRQALR